MTPRQVLLAATVWCLVLGVLIHGGTELFAAQPAPVRVFVQPGAHLAPVLNLIKQARHSIRMEMYLLTNRTIVKELGRARQRGLDVRVVLEHHPFGGDRYARLGYDALSAVRVPVRWADDRRYRFTHDKVLEADGSVAEILTSNLTSSGIFRNREFGVVDQSPSDARAIANIIDADWSRRIPAIPSSRLVVSPINSRSRLDKLIDGARHSLDVYAEEVADTSLEGHLASAARRGVRVRLITSNRGAGVDTIRAGGVSVRVIPHPYMHAKAILSDRRSVFVGSENLSSTSVDQNRELGIVLSDPGVIATIAGTFSSDWRRPATRSAAPPPPSTSSGGFSVRLVASPTVVRRGQRLTLTAATAAGATCRIRVTYPDGYVSTARALTGTRRADSSGIAVWTWHVGTRVKGTSHAQATCSQGSGTSTAETSFEVR